MELNLTGYQEQGSPIRIGLRDSVYGLQVYMYLRYRDGISKVLNLRPDGQGWDYESVDELVSVDKPSFIIPEEFSRALLEALMRHYDGAQDLHTVRSDLVHERGRVDKLIDTVSKIALGE